MTKDKKVVFFDMDGVFADFIAAVFGAFNRARPEQYPVGKFTAADITTHDGFEQLLGVDKDEFWRVLDARGEIFWSSDILPYPWYRTLFHLAEELKVEAFVATAPSRKPHCLSGKAKWIQTYLPDYARRVVFGPNKHLLARPGRILVDDRPENVKRFIAHGGEALLFPQPYNTEGLSEDPWEGFHIARDTLERWAKE